MRDAMTNYHTVSLINVDSCVFFALNARPCSIGKSLVASDQTNFHPGTIDRHRYRHPADPHGQQREAAWHPRPHRLPEGVQ